MSGGRFNQEILDPIIRPHLECGTKGCNRSGEYFGHCDEHWFAMPRSDRRRVQRAAVKAAKKGRSLAFRPEPTHPTTWWNGEPCKATRVRVIVGESPRSTWWCAKLAGTERAAVRVDYHGQTFYLDDEDESGWRKVTAGLGSPWESHRSLPVDREVQE